MKKLRQMGAVVTALALALTLLVIPASAVSFTDMDGHWAKSDVEALATQGIINGYSDGTFKPDAKMSAAEALLFCARVTDVSQAIENQLAQDYYDVLYPMLPEVMRSWAIPELAVCLETGIISQTELSAMCTSGAISQAITRENLSLYLVRAMQLEPMAKQLSAYALPFDDAEHISQRMQPYVYLLYTYGVTGGNEKNEFMPASTVSRAEMAVMLKRALDFMDRNGVVVELADYTTHDWLGGVITSAVSGSSGAIQLTLSNDLSGARSVTLPSDVKIYANNMRSSSAALQSGQYARVNLNSAGRAESVRLGGALTTYTGSVSSLDGGTLTITADGISRQYRIDRFTQVQVGQKVGDSSLIDESAGYTAATCRVDTLGHLAMLQLSGGTRQEEGLIKSVTLSAGGSAVLRVSGFNGEIQRYTVPSGAGIFVNGLSGVLSSSYVGDYVALRVSNDSASEAATVQIDTVTQYIQGSLKSVRTSSTPSTITISDFSTGKTATYDVASGAVITYEGETIALRRLESGCFVTLRLSGDEVTLVDAYPGSSTVEGTVTGISYGTLTELDVTLADGTTATYTVDLTDPPDIYRGDALSTIDKLRTGDQVVLTIRYSTISRIEATPQSANMEGTITRITMEAAGVTLDLTLTDGSTVSYLVGDGVSVSQDGDAVSLYSLKPGYRVSLVVNSDQVVSIEVDQASGSSTQLTGTVLFVNTGDKTILLQWNDSSGATSVTTVKASGATVIGVGGGGLSLSDLETGDVVQIYGGYDGLDFRATLVIRM